MTGLLWRKFTAYSISAALVIYPNIASNGCSEFEDFESTSILFAPEIIHQPSFEPFFYAPNSHYYGDREMPETSESSDNLSEWAAYFKTKASLQDLDSVIYGTDIKEVQELIKVNTSRKSLPASHPLAKNTAVQAVFQANDQEFLNYLLFAKKCGPFVSLDAWEEERQVQPAMSKLMVEGKKQYALALSPVIKLRYAFQVVRLAHYNQDYKGCIQLYNELVAPLPQESLIKYWAMAHKAGALKATQAYPEAVYLYSRVFEKCPSRQLAAFGSIQFSQAEWLPKSLALCKSQEEKNTIGFLASLEHPDYDLPSLQKMFQAAPNDPRLLVLLGREINKLETSGMSSGNTAGEKATAQSPGKALRDFVIQAADQKTIAQPELWFFAAGYLSYLDKDWANVKSYFKKARKANSKDEVLQGQIRIIEIMLKVAEAKKLDLKFENDILSDINWLKTAKTINLRFGNAYTFLMNVLGKKYKEQGNKLMSYLCFSRAEDGSYAYYGHSHYMFYRPDAPFTRELIVWMDKTTKTDFEKFLYKDFKPTKNELIELEGSLLLAKYQFKEAITKFSLVDSAGGPGSENYTLPADPFAIHINDCHDCDFVAPKKKTYTKRSFAEEMLNFEELIVKDAKNAGQYYFFLANGYYNLSYYGNTWMAIDYSSRSRDDKDVTYTDNSKALEFYLKALSLTKNKEFAAKCLFMASKCEQNAYYNSPGYEEERKNQPRAYFKTLKDNYSSTKYYQQVIGECERFAKYVK